MQQGGDHAQSGSVHHAHDTLCLQAAFQDREVQRAARGPCWIPAEEGLRHLLSGALASASWRGGHGS